MNNVLVSEIQSQREYLNGLIELTEEARALAEKYKTVYWARTYRQQLARAEKAKLELSLLMKRPASQGTLVICPQCFGSGKVHGPGEEGPNPAWIEENCPKCNPQNFPPSTQNTDS